MAAGSNEIRRPNSYLSIPQADFVCAAVDQPLHDVATGLIPPSQLIRHRAILALIEHLQKSAARERADPNIKCKRNKRIELVLIERYLDPGINGLFGGLHVLTQEVERLLIRQAIRISDRHSRDYNITGRLFGLGDEMADADRRESGGILIDVKLEPLPCFSNSRPFSLICMIALLPICNACSQKQGDVVADYTIDVTQLSILCDHRHIRRETGLCVRTALVITIELAIAVPINAETPSVANRHSGKRQRRSGIGGLNERLKRQ